MANGVVPGTEAYLQGRSITSGKPAATVVKIDRLTDNEQSVIQKARSQGVIINAREAQKGLTLIRKSYIAWLEMAKRQRVMAVKPEAPMPGLTRPIPLRPPAVAPAFYQPLRPPVAKTALISVSGVSKVAQRPMSITLPIDVARDTIQSLITKAYNLGVYVGSGEASRALSLAKSRLSSGRW